MNFLGEAGVPHSNYYYGISDSLVAQSSDDIAPGIVSVANSIRVAGESFIDALARARMQVAMSNFQSEMLEINLHRARNGQMPLTTDEYANVGAARSNDKYIWYGIGVLALLILFTSRSR